MSLFIVLEAFFLGFRFSFDVRDERLTRLGCRHLRDVPLLRFRPTALIL